MTSRHLLRMCCWSELARARCNMRRKSWKERVVFSHFPVGSILDVIPEVFNKIKVRGSCRPFHALSPRCLSMKINSIPMAAAHDRQKCNFFPVAWNSIKWTISWYKRFIGHCHFVPNKIAHPSFWNDKSRIIFELSQKVTDRDFLFGWVYFGSIAVNVKGCEVTA